MKRTAERQITQLDPPDDEESEDDEAGETFSRASEAAMAMRRVVRVKGAKGGNEDKKEGSSNPFEEVVLKSDKPMPKADAEKDATKDSESKGSGNAASSKRQRVDASAKETEPNATKTELDEEKPKASVFGSGSGFSGFGTTSSSGGFGAAKGGFGSFDSKPFGSSTTFKVFGSFSGTRTVGFQSSLKEEPKAGETKAEEQSDDADDPVLTLPDSYDGKSGEEDEEVVFDSRCKAFRWGKRSRPREDGETGKLAPSIPHSTDSDIKPAEVENEEEIKPEWIEVGLGALKLLQQRTNPSNSYARIVLRRQTQPSDTPTTILLNFFIGKESTATAQADSDRHINVLGSVSGEMIQVLLKFSEENAKAFHKKIEAVIASCEKSLYS